MEQARQRNQWLDFLKGIAILSVVFYHLGILTYGYLGVDLFLVINGYLVASSTLRHPDTHLHYWAFLKKKLLRLWPVLIAACLVSLVMGFFTMLPDDYENLSEAVVAALFFAENILSFITTGNYWDISNEFKPLMHTWYLGIIFQYYLLYPFITLIVYKCAGGGEAEACCAYSRP